MQRSLFQQEIAPFLLAFGLLVAAALLGDGLLHLFDLAWVGRWLGIPGVLLILLSFLYSLRKRGRIRWGSPKWLLRLHQLLAWLGALMILIHSGIHFHAILPWLATLAMLVNVVSGLTGQFLLARARRHVAARREGYRRQGVPEGEVERALFWDAVTLDLMGRWRAVHFPITLVFAVLGVAHLISILLFWGWR